MEPFLQIIIIYMPAKIFPSYITEEYYNQNINYTDITNIYNICNINDIIEINNIQNDIIIINYIVRREIQFVTIHLLQS